MFLQAGQILQRADLAEFGALPDVLQVQHARGDLKRAVTVGGGVGNGLDVVLAEDHELGIELFADFDHGSFGQQRVGPQGQAAVSLHALVAIERHESLGRERFADGFGQALTDPIEIRILRDVEKRKNQVGRGLRGRKQKTKNRQSA